MLATSPQSLQEFGQRALGNPSEESLRHLHHVAIVSMGERAFPEAEAWNARMLAMAQQLNNRTYINLAALNTLTIQQLRDQSVTQEQADAAVARYRSGVPMLMARTLQARVLIDNQQAPAAIKVLGDVLRRLPRVEGEGPADEVMIWRAVGLAHGQLDDVAGYLAAMRTVEEKMAETGYPWPDYEGTYHLALTLGYIGQYDDADYVAGVYQELAQRNGQPLRLAMAGSLCGYIAAAKDDWAKVLECYAPFGPNLDVPERIYNVMLPRRAVGYARTGQLALARRDLTTLRNRLDAGKIEFTPAIHRAEAEVMIASGDYKRGVKALRDYHLRQFRTASELSGSVMGEVVGDMDKQLREVQAQSQNRATTIATLSWLVAMVVLLALITMALLFKQRRLSKALTAANAREREELERRGQFFADISHEIRTPLNGVVALADALEKEDLPPEIAEKVRLINSSSELLNRLLSDVLDNAKMQAGQLSVEPTVFNLTRLIRDTTALWRPKAESKGLKLELQSDFSDDVWVMGDGMRLAQVINNLISNSLKFTPEGRILINVVDLPAERVLFVVTDTGIGFDVPDAGSIFERYRQADRSISRTFGGTGLGLAISQKLISLMGGQLQAKSAPNEGAQFWFDLPLPVQQAPEAEAAPVTQVPRDPSGPMRVLIVDDNQTNRTIVGMLLADRDYQLHYAVNGQEAVEAAAAMRFDVILMDIQMPVMDGLEAIRRIRHAEVQCGTELAAIVIFSANDSADDYRTGVEAGADTQLSKPVVLDRLLEAIDSAIQIRSNLSQKSAEADFDIMSASINP
ncbi:ATP-binding protein [uncultured Brevundimonas sp.]|uniref:hybrid sensor histidine kinase/response regulator n=1 Tax=uncultured Brevundimonas sp. TaxID=213418 RepID=UPI002623B78B|nr:ATP-binding protein [uncultured Brevundimonas sp.]